MGNLIGGLGGDERGATPVVGILLIVAIAIVLAAVVGQSIFGYDLVQAPEAAPAVSFDHQYEETNATYGQLTIRHESGTTLGNGSTSFAVSGGDGDYDESASTIPETIESGNDVMLAGIAPDETVRLIWEHPETGDSYVLFTWTGPEA